MKKFKKLVLFLRSIFMDLVAILNSSKVRSDIEKELRVLDTSVHNEIYLLSRLINRRLRHIALRERVAMCRKYIEDYKRGLNNGYNEELISGNVSHCYKSGHEKGFIIRGAIIADMENGDYMKARTYEGLFEQLNITLSLICQELEES